MKVSRITLLDPPPARFARFLKKSGELFGNLVATLVLLALGVTIVSVTLLLCVKLLIAMWGWVF